MPLFVIYNWYYHTSFFILLLQNIQSVTPSEYGSEAKDVMISMQNMKFPEANIPSNNLSLINVRIEYRCQFSEISKYDLNHAFVTINSLADDFSKEMPTSPILCKINYAEFFEKKHADFNLDLFTQPPQII